MNNKNCPCKRIKCERYGNCNACREHHKNKKSLTFCDRLKKKEQRKADRQRKGNGNLRKGVI